ncbi:MAG: hypothetical protein OEO21_12340 [Candidatus Krumholzibacteria bacterium]|nr:hypothetical protein [Candidatus Krumholzibacteria bacterium]
MRNVIAAFVFCVLAVGPVAAEQTAHPFVPDQSNDLILTSQGFVIPGFGQVGQSFVPTFSLLDVVELQMNSQLTESGGTAVVQIRSGTIAGPILGVSQSASVPPYPGPAFTLAHFDFLVPVALTPGSTYVIEVIAISGTMGVFTSGFGANTYPQGTAFFMGAAQPGDDLWFREGSGVVVPVAEVSWGRIKALYE